LLVSVRCSGVAELALGAVRAVEDEFGRLIEIVPDVVRAPTFVVVREPPPVADRLMRPRQR